MAPEFLSFIYTKEGLNFVSNCCLVVTISMFASGLPQCVQLMKQNCPGNVRYLPFLMTFVNCIAWILYGRITKNNTLIVVNGVGAILQLFYMVVYINVATDKTFLIRRSVITFTILFLTKYFIETVFTDKMAIEVLGSCCCFITVLMFASPLAELKTVLKNHSTETLSFPLTVTSFLCALLWTLFGLAMADSFIIIPNILGLATSIFRFYLFTKYPSKTSNKSSIQL